MAKNKKLYIMISQEDAILAYDSIRSSIKSLEQAFPKIKDSYHDESYSYNLYYLSKVREDWRDTAFRLKNALGELGHRVADID